MLGNIVYRRLQQNRWRQLKYSDSVTYVPVAILWLRDTPTELFLRGYPFLLTSQWLLRD